MLEIQDKKQSSVNNYSIDSNNFIATSENFIQKSLLEHALHSYSFNKMPPIIGIIMADKYGNALMVFEYNSKGKNHYGSINSYLSEEDKNLIDLNLISSYFSAFKSFAGEINIQNLSNLEIGGSNIKIQMYFLFDQYMIIVFLNSQIDLNSKEKAYIIKYFEERLVKYENELKYFNAAKSREIIRTLENNGKNWLKILNNSLIQSYKKCYLQRHLNIEDLINGFDSIIQEELFGDLTNIPEEILKNLSMEINNKIQDRLFENLKNKNE